ncbi:E3 ubiquitin-protein ligase CIP8-like isoform X2 [Phoenix dactylifera]|uniref:RING-type E3 ubiquitin transferase n=1 Tax=Phoenix dactylifera TaxID=42345 RepID=A0A8B8J7K6_PHODC|nr:E3 ubiquitin-protein ligase CIP8-like isoform X2 [Phoenix dactylifera]
MAKVAELFLLPFEEVLEGEGDEDEDVDIEDYNPETLDLPPFFSFDLPLSPPSPTFDSPGLILPAFSSPSSYPSPRSRAEILDPADFRVLDGAEDMGSDYLGLGPGLGFDDDQEIRGGADFFVDRHGRSEHPHDAPSRGGEGLRIVGPGSDSDSEDEQIAAGGSNSDAGGYRSDDLPSPLCWDCLRIEDDRRGDLDEDFEWEEVDGRLDEREVLSMMVGDDEELSGSTQREEELLDVEIDEQEARNLNWEVLLAVNTIGGNSLMELEDAESYLGDERDDVVDPSEYEILFGQFTEQNSSIKGSPPAAQSVVENLPSVVVTKEDVANDIIFCAVCKDEISLGETAKRLPCSHHYHGGCIVPWLGIRNTCPVCRYELPTDDPEYENQRARRATCAGSMESSSRARLWKSSLLKSLPVNFFDYGLSYLKH